MSEFKVNEGYMYKGVRYPSMAARDAVWQKDYISEQEAKHRAKAQKNDDGVFEEIAVLLPPMRNIVDALDIPVSTPNELLESLKFIASLIKVLGNEGHAASEQEIIAVLRHLMPYMEQLDPNSNPSTREVAAALVKMEAEA